MAAGAGHLTVAAAHVGAMTDQSSELPRPAGAERVACPWCEVPVGTPCVSRIGRRPRPTHSARWDAYKWRLRGSRFVVQVREDDARLGVRAGEQYVAQVYWLDPGKVTLLSRVPDGFDPECNHYWPEVEWLRWENQA